MLNNTNYNQPQSRGTKIANSTNVTPSNKRHANKNNLLTNKALAYLNSKKSNMRLYEEQT